MLARTDLRGIPGSLRAALAPSTAGGADGAVVASVAEIIAGVRRGGDAALVAYTERFDGVRPTALAVRPERRTAALAAVSPALRAALESARDEIGAWHEAQRERGARRTTGGIEVHEAIVPVDRAGCYVPGGRACYPSSVLMTAVPARVAGVAEVVLCVPPGPDGEIPDAVLAAAELAGVDEIYCVGGAQAVAAMAYGTESVAPVDVIVGPGNAYVAEAKRQVFGTVGIDSLAGPSEVVVVADDTVDPAWVAADLLAQAEHGPGGMATLVTWVPELADRVELALDALLATTTRRAEAESTLRSGGRIVLVDGAERAVDAANAIAPEHLQLMCRQASVLVTLVRNAGAVFVGPLGSAVLGDYAVGTNHVLPTGGSARFASALRVDDFTKRVHIVHVTDEGFARLAPVARVIAEEEGLLGHADALRIREPEDR
ncbi:MAG: histidinol dehydrogenase [Actinomycetota bacterium]